MRILPALVYSFFLLESPSLLHLAVSSHLDAFLPPGHVRDHQPVPGDDSRARPRGRRSFDRCLLPFYQLPTGDLGRVHHPTDDARSKGLQAVVL